MPRLTGIRLTPGTTCLTKELQHETTWPWAHWFAGAGPGAGVVGTATAMAAMETKATTDVNCILKSGDCSTWLRRGNGLKKCGIGLNLLVIVGLMKLLSAG